MKKVVFAILLSLTVSGSAFAQEKAGAKPAAGGGDSKEGYGYEFSDDPLSAGGFGPQDATIRVRPGPVRTTLIRPRTSFVPEMLRVRRKPLSLFFCSVALWPSSRKGWNTAPRRRKDDDGKPGKAKVALTFALYQGDQLVRRETIAQDIVKVGKDPRSHLRVDDELTSRIAVIEVASPSDITLIDLGYEPGTLVNGQRVNKCKIRPGDQVQIGGTLIQLENAGNRRGWSRQRHRRLLRRRPLPQFPTMRTTSLPPSVLRRFRRQQGRVAPLRRRSPARTPSHRPRPPRPRRTRLGGERLRLLRTRSPRQPIRLQRRTPSWRKPLRSRRTARSWWTSKKEIPTRPRAATRTRS